jgi:hypothetical protein
MPFAGYLSWWRLPKNRNRAVANATSQKKTKAERMLLHRIIAVH